MNDSLFSVEGQVVLVSGASRGIGRAIAAGFAERRARVVITGRDATTLQKTAQEIGREDGSVRAIVCDVADSPSIGRLVEQVMDETGRIDTLINVAGVNRRKPALDV
ncbi:MAG: SDR family NAD(P)-dependent oxidoreductase, partial [Planctomycetes bacterium]|nr:SDR family NAD(P)-dependent oxidoreductase [Planctomycetota bacterium]